MKLVVAQCPLCGEESAIVDCLVPRFILTTGDRMCPHVAFLSAGLAVQNSNCSTVKSRGGSWFWIRGRRRISSSQSTPLSRYVDMIACDLLPGVDLPKVPYMRGGGTALEREMIRRGSGEIRLPPQGSLSGTFDAWGLFSDDPAALIHETMQLAGVR